MSTLFFKKALATLEEALGEYTSRPGDLLARDGVIQRFEYCYELGLKTLEKYLKQTAISENEIAGLSFKDIIRIAAQKGWIDSPEAWFQYREARNKTSHAYSNMVADEVFETIQPFLAAAKSLLAQLESIDH